MEMESSFPSKRRWLNFVFTVTGCCTYVLDVGTDLFVAHEFYTHGECVWFGLMLGFMLASSVIVQFFSWFWLKYDLGLENVQKTHKHILLFGSKRRYKLMCLLHVCQLGFLFRHVSAIWLSFCVWWRGAKGSEYVVYLTHDLSLLQLIETFCESVPQLGLLIYVMIRHNRAQTFQCVGVAVSTMSIAWMVVDYHRSLRFFLPEKTKQKWLSSGVYFLWNLLLIGPRLACVSLFASVLPNYVPVHFLTLWPALTLWSCLQGTELMDSEAGEWLYRGTVGVIWYFSWFNVAEGRTRDRSLIYHTFIMTDNIILLLTWWWLRDPEISRCYSLVLLVLLLSCYLIGLMVKALYYCFFHPNRREPPPPDVVGHDVPDGLLAPCGVTEPDTSKSSVLNKRMERHAANFYSARTHKTTGPHENSVI